MLASESALHPMLRKLEYWSSLEEADRQALLALPHVVRPCERHEYVVRERDKATHSYLMLSGYSIRHKTVFEGGRQVVSIHMQGDIVDLQNTMLAVADYSVQMLTAGEVAMIPREAIRQIAKDRPDVGMAMWHDTLVDSSIFGEWIANVGRRDAYVRIAHLLCEFSLRLRVAGLGDQSNYELPMTQEQLADSVGLTSVHVNRTLKALQQDGLIERPSARSVVIGDWKKLAAAGDFDSTYLHLKEDEPALA